VLLICGFFVVARESELTNGTELAMASYNGSEAEPQSVEMEEVLCAPPVANKTWQMASGYIGAVLMLVMAVYGRYAATVARVPNIRSGFPLVLISP